MVALAAMQLCRLRSLPILVARGGVQGTSMEYEAGYKGVHLE
jgi:hypothetical protein